MKTLRSVDAGSPISAAQLKEPGAGHLIADFSQICRDVKPTGKELCIINNGFACS